MRSIFPITVIAVSLHGYAFSQLPLCKDSFPSSLLLNNSFEEYSGCSPVNGGMYEGGRVDAPLSTGGITLNNWHSFASNTWEVHYKNYNCRINKFNSIFDTTDFVND